MKNKALGGPKGTSKTRYFVVLFAPPSQDPPKGTKIETIRAA